MSDFCSVKNQSICSKKLRAAEAEVARLREALTAYYDAKNSEEFEAAVSAAWKILAD